MSQDSETTGQGAGFDALEEKVLKAVALIERLKAERASLIVARAELEARLARQSASNDRAAGAGSDFDGNDETVHELRDRVAELEREKALWIRDKRDLTRRVEEIVVKLEFLEAESVQPG
jgi:chromosome segregation ATPase